MDFSTRYHRWNTSHAAVLTGLAAVSLIPESGAIVLSGRQLSSVAWLATALWAAIAIPRLYALGRRNLGDEVGSPLPNLLTAIRAVAAIGLFLTVGVADLFLGNGTGAGPIAAWTFVAILALVELSDFFDGRIARRYGPSVFGATWDMECDALFTLALSVTAHRIFGVGAFVLAIGLMRYVYVLIWRYDGDPPRFPAVFKLYAKTTAAALVVTLIATMAPVVGQRLRAGALMVVLTMQAISFGWEIALHRRAVAAGASRGGDGADPANDDRR